MPVDSTRTLPHQGVRGYSQVAVVVLALVGIFWLVASQLSPRLSVAISALVLGVLGSAVLARVRKLHRLNRVLALVMVGLVTLGLVASVTLVIAQLVYADRMTEWLGYNPSAPVLLRNAALIWVSNVLVFAVWYWEVDGGGPMERHAGRYRSDDVVFPQLQRDGQHAGWVPDFVDYLFLAFNSSTAFSPTDTLVLSRRMKALMVCQSLISLAVLSVLTARAVNALA